MKKLVTCILALCFLLTPMVVSAEQMVGFLIPVSGLGDQSFNDMTYAGLVKAKNQYNFKLDREVCSGNSIEHRVQAMEKLITRGSKIIVSNGWEFTDVVEEYAKKYPDHIFVINDFPINGYLNVISTVFAQHEGSFIAGALAGWVSKHGKIGFIGGKDMPVIRAFLTGYMEGALYADPDIDVIVDFLSGKNDNASGFDNPAIAYERASAMYEQGADIVFGVAGLAGNGIIQSAVKHNMFAIGVDADQDYMAKGNVLTSVMKRLDRATYEILSQLFSGKNVSGVYQFGLKENGVALSPMVYTKHLLPIEVQKKLEILQEEIRSGNIQVTDILNNDQNSDNK